MTKYLLLTTLCIVLMPVALNAQNDKKEILLVEKLNLSLGGRFNLDGATYFSDVTPLDNGVGMSDLRLSLKAGYNKWDAKIDVGFAHSKVSMKDVFLQYNLNEKSYLRAGHYAEAFGLDFMESSSTIKFITESASSQAFSPGRKLGVEYTVWTKSLWLAGGVFGDKDINNSTKGDDGYAVTGRVVLNPFKSTGKILHFGLAGSYRKADAAGREPSGENSPREVVYLSNAGTYIETTEFITATVNDAKNQMKYAVELIGARGAVHLQAEYFNTNVKRKNNLETYKAQGVYGQIGFLALGGHYSYVPSVARLAMPEPKSLEFVARYNVTDLNDNENIMGGKQRDISVAANYYLNRYIVFRLNYVNVNLDEYALNGKENFNLIQARLQVVF